uniref:Pkinase_fungal domain-containing protein n=1 Tax=Steinernema glaseri TaxID=37863 RepID=A0A1I7Z6E6_9BILA
MAYKDDVRSLFLGIAHTRKTTFFMFGEQFWLDRQMERLRVSTDPRMFNFNPQYGLLEILHPGFKVESFERKEVLRTGQIYFSTFRKAVCLILEGLITLEEVPNTHRLAAPEIRGYNGEPQSVKCDVKQKFYEQSVPHSHWEAFFRVFGQYIEILYICSRKMDAKKFEIFARCISGLPKLREFCVADAKECKDAVRTLFLEIADARRTTYYMSNRPYSMDHLKISTNPRWFDYIPSYQHLETCFTRLTLASRSPKGEEWTTQGDRTTSRSPQRRNSSAKSMFISGIRSPASTGRTYKSTSEASGRSLRS